MSNHNTTFADKIFDYIRNEYGKAVLQNVQSNSHKSMVNKLIDSSEKQNDSVDHAANKIIAMLRANP